PSIAPYTSHRSSPTRGAATTKGCSPSSTLRPSTSTTTTSARNLTANPARRTPLYLRHVALGGRMVDFGGWEMPQQYTSIRDEHLAVRKAAGLFDVSHMGRLSIEGRHAEAFLNGVVTNDVAGVQPGHAQYNLMCREDGGIIDDLVIYKSSPTDFVVVVNASNREKDVAWLRAHLPSGAAMEDRTDEVSLLAYQGPRAEE